MIVDDERLFAEALEFVLVADGIVVDSIASSVREALDVVRLGRPDVVILGAEAPTAADVRQGETIMEACRTARVLVLAAKVDRGQAQRMARAGMHCMSKTSSVSDLVRAIRMLANGGTPTPSAVIANGMEPAIGHPGGAPPGTGLTPRELEVLKLVAVGAPGRLIARRLGISENTVRTHSQSILVKLRVHSRLEATAYAIRTGLVRLRSQESDELAV